jgi:hypothetical protein
MKTVSALVFSGPRQLTMYFILTMKWTNFAATPVRGDDTAAMGRKLPQAQSGRSMLHQKLPRVLAQYKPPIAVVAIWPVTSQPLATLTQCHWRGAAKKKVDGPPRAFTKSQTHQPTPPTFFSLAFFFSTFWGVSRQGEFKNTIQIFLQKVHVENFFQNFDKQISMSGFPRLFLFYRIFGCFSAMGVQKHYKKRFAKKIVSKSFSKNSTKNPKPTFSRIFFITFLGVSR